ncbi:hypothetical protein CI610_01123 [invertebrate metagenome]|uniref:Uncharacterized protein n=1 Tax=invertebrate metagenome TaxID=1711999 RepID=A0A2H9T9M5_9ZZZZ
MPDNSGTPPNVEAIPDNEQSVLLAFVEEQIYFIPFIS